jgi:CTP synthase (UTP-ammonia lyase)
MTSKIALIGDYSESVIAHTAIPRALKLSAIKIEIQYSWIETIAIKKNASILHEFSGIWVVPGSPYKSMDGALAAIQYARERGRPFLGTCGGFQHALIEYARNVCGAYDATHAETAPNKDTLVVTPLACSLIEKTGSILFMPNSRLYKIFQGKEINEKYHCSYGLNPEWKNCLEEAGMHFTGFDTEGQVRAFELNNHPFFIGTLFQPERSALYDQPQPHPLITALVKAAFL